LTALTPVSSIRLRTKLAPMKPNHLARAHIITDPLFNHGAVCERNFYVELSFSPLGLAQALDVRSA
jgi:hypothetical protein